MALQIGQSEKFLKSCGVLVQKGVYNNQSISQSGQNFTSGANLGQKLGKLSSNLQNLSNLKSFISLIPSGTFGNKNDIKIDPTWLETLNRVAQKMVDYGEVSIEAATDFLYILITVDNIEDMTIIADAVQISELVNENIINNASEILAINQLYKCAYLAEAIYSLIKTYAKFTNMRNHQQNNIGQSADPIDMINQVMGNLGSVTSLLSTADGAGTGGNPSAASAENILGNILTKLTQGKEIPMGIQANNPTLKSPSMLGRMMFGESPTGTGAIDPKQLFAKPIAIFSQLQSGAGSAMMDGKTSGSLNQSQPMNSVIEKILFGGNTPSAGSFGEDLLTQIQSKVGDMTGGAGQNIDLKRGDNSIPFMNAFSDAMSGISEKLPDINKEFRSQFEKLTRNSINIKEIIEKNGNIEELIKKGLNEESTQVPQITGDIKSIFGSNIFQQGFKDMLSAVQSLEIASPGASKVLGTFT